MTVNKTIMKQRKTSSRKRTLPKPGKTLPAEKSSEAPQRTVIVIDCSGSAGDDDIKPNRLGAEKESAIAFVNERASISSRDEIAVVSYEAHARLECKLQTIRNMQAIKTAINRIKLGGATAMGDGLREARKALTYLPQHSPVNSILNWFNATPAPPPDQFLQRVILLTDGHHCYGREPLPVAMKLKNSGVQIDCIGIGGCKSDVDEGLLKLIASIDPATGKPRYRFIKDKKTLKKHFQQLATGLTR